MLTPHFQPLPATGWPKQTLDIKFLNFRIFRKFPSISIGNPYQNLEFPEIFEILKISRSKNVDIKILNFFETNALIEKVPKQIAQRGLRLA